MTDRPSSPSYAAGVRKDEDEQEHEQEPQQQDDVADDAASRVSGLTTTEQSTVGKAASTISSVLYAPVGYLFGGSNDKDAVAEEGENDLSGRNVSVPGGGRDGGDDNEEVTDYTPPAIDFLLDNKREMTWSRRIALAQMHKTWYYPRAREVEEETERALVDAMDATDTEPKRVVIEKRPPKQTRKEDPSLAKAWGYFEHFALPRHIVDEDSKKGNLKRAEPGENQLPTKLYDPLCTPLSQMGDFGLGIGLYFSTLRAITILTILAGLLNIPNFMYFSSSEYSDGQPGVPTLMKGSAICTVKQWVHCTDCTVEDFDGDEKKMGWVIRDDGTNFTVAQRNDCGVDENGDRNFPTFQQGMISYATMLLIVVGIFVTNWYQKGKEIEFDEDEQTAQDYSIRITNPPKDASNPEEWRTFFYENFGGAHATAITIALDNDLLVRALVERREAMKRIELHVEPGTSLDTLTLAKLGAEVERDRGLFGRLMAKVSPGIPELFGRIAELEAKIKGWAQIEYPVSNVFVSFETEEAQRKVLKALNLGRIDIRRNKTGALKHDKYIFRRGRSDELVLDVKEPDEPSTIRWADLNVRFKDKMKPLVTTTLCTMIAIVCIALIIWIVHDIDAIFGAIAIALANSVFPEVAKFLTSFERHASEGLKQTSLYFKIAIFRWVNTAVVITIITPFTRTIDLGDGLIPSIYAIFFAELVTTNLIQLVDIGGQFKRHFLAPRAATQDLMNLSMTGQEWELAERYTNVTKIFFLSLWYCSIYPGGLFMCAFILFVNYFTDRFSLMRTWKRVGALGTNIAAFSRRYFFNATICAMAVLSSYFWAGFPYDNLCENEGTDSAEYAGTWNNIILGNDEPYVKDGEPVPITILSEDSTYRYCLQDLIRIKGPSFPAIPQFQPEGEEWMSEDQENITTIYGWSSVGVLGAVVASLFWGAFKKFQGLFKGKYKSKGDDQEQPFSEVPSISTYIPQVESFVFSYPLLACNYKGIKKELFDWQDPDRPYSYYDLTLDAADLLEGLGLEDKTVFSVVSYAAPPGKQRRSKKSVLSMMNASASSSTKPSTNPLEGDTTEVPDTTTL